MTLADQIIDGGPYASGDLNPLYPIINAPDLNQLRDELLELQQLRAAANELRAIVHRWQNGPAYDIRQFGADLAELVRRADQHTEDCR